MLPCQLCENSQQLTQHMAASWLLYVCVLSLLVPIHNYNEAPTYHLSMQALCYRARYVTMRELRALLCSTMRSVTAHRLRSKTVRAIFIGHKEAACILLYSNFPMRGGTAHTIIIVNHNNTSCSSTRKRNNEISHVT